MNVKELNLEVQAVGYSTVDDIDGSGADRKGMMIQFTDRTRWDGFYRKWFMIPEAHQTEMLEIALYAIENERWLAVGIEYPGNYKEIQDLVFPEVKSMFITKKA